MGELSDQVKKMAQKAISLDTRKTIRERIEEFMRSSPMVVVEAKVDGRVSQENT